jgi:hypothetical protein
MPKTLIARPMRKLALAFVLTLSIGLGLAERAPALEPANGFAVSLQANGTFSRDGAYQFSEGGFSESGTVTTDGGYSVSGASFMPVYFPTGGTDKRTSNFMVDQGSSSFSGNVSATEVMSNSNGGSENSTCTAPYTSSQQDIFPLAYRGLAGGSFQIFVAPSESANRDSGAIDCGGDSYAVDQLLFPTRGSFDGGSPPPDPPFEAARTVTVTQSQLERQSFSVPVSFSTQGTQSWAQDADPPHGYCDFSVPAGRAGNCSWAHEWSGTLTFTRVCSAAEGGMVDFLNPQAGDDGVTRWFAAGACTGGGDGSECVVPKVKGKKLKKAKRKIERANCTVGKVKKKPSEKVDKGRVIKQKPKPETRKPAGAAVKLVVSKGPKD